MDGYLNNSTDSTDVWKPSDQSIKAKPIEIESQAVIGIVENKDKDILMAEEVQTGSKE